MGKKNLATAVKRQIDEKWERLIFWLQLFWKKATCGGESAAKMLC